MKFGVVTLCFLCCSFFAFGFPQDHGPAKSSPAIGLEVGRKAPSFSAIDQFGHPQSGETLQGTGGTVLLFFRSADW